MTAAMPRCVTCGTAENVRLIAGPTTGDACGCSAHLQGLRGRLDDELDDLTWLQETRPQRMESRNL